MPILRFARKVLSVELVSAKPFAIISGTGAAERWENLSETTDWVDFSGGFDRVTQVGLAHGGADRVAGTAFRVGPAPRARPNNRPRAAKGKGKTGREIGGNGTREMPGTINERRPNPPAVAATRIVSIDVLRGLVMALMLLDHVRDFTHRGALLYNPQDLEWTNSAVYWTRWSSHFCAPIFVLLAGISVRIQTSRGTPRKTVSRKLVVRGLFLIALELAILRPLIWFHLDYHLLAHLQVIWVIGWSMIILAGLIWLPLKWIACFGVVLIAGHNFLDTVVVEPGNAWAVIWALLHQSTPIWVRPPSELAEGIVVFVHYPLVPWPGVMALGYVLGEMYTWPRSRRQVTLQVLGGCACGLFVVLRGSNLYGDPHPWQIPGIAESPQLRDWERVVFSFLNTEKYPPSLLFLLMTLGPGILGLAWLEKIGLNRWTRFALAFGAVPLFFYILQWPILHLTSLAFQWVSSPSVGWSIFNPFSIAYRPPAGAGFSLEITYLAWFLDLLLLYPLCVLFGRFKQRHRK